MYKVKEIKIGNTNIKCYYDTTKSNINEQIKKIITQCIEEKYHE